MGRKRVAAAKGTPVSTKKAKLDQSATPSQPGRGADTDPGLVEGCLLLHPHRMEKRPVLGEAVGQVGSRVENSRQAHRERGIVSVDPRE